jgi:ribosomal protein S18 acetylase RimI-like enzyme
MKMRPYSNEEDYVRMRQLLVDIYTLNGPPVYCTVGELDWWRCLSLGGNTLEQVQLWLDDEQHVMGYIWPEGGATFILFIHPKHPELVDEMLDWVEQNSTAFSPVKDDLPEMSISCSSSDRVLRRALEKRSYERGGEYFSFRSRKLTGTIGPSQLPPGYSIRSIQNDEDLILRVEVHRAAFSPSRMSLEKYRILTGFPAYHRDLDLVAVAPDGSFAAFALLWLDEANRAATFEPIGTHPNHRRLGLARALINEGCRRLHDMNIKVVHTQSWGGDFCAARLYQSTGLAEIDRIYDWRKSQ